MLLEQSLADRRWNHALLQRVQGLLLLVWGLVSPALLPALGHLGLAVGLACLQLHGALHPEVLPEPLLQLPVKPS